MTETVTFSDSDSEAQPSCEPAYEQVHAEAIRQGQHSYIDPKTGYLVFTELYLLAKGFCCRSGCRHCPYGYSG